MAEEGPKYTGFETLAIHGGQQPDPTPAGIETLDDLIADLESALANA